MKVSVAMATFNGEKYVSEQIDSIIPQLNKDDELIISDDSSTDKTVDIIQSYRDERIKLIQNKNGKGVIKNFENALSYCTGDIIFLSDQDDVWLPEKVEVCKKNLQQYDIVVTDCIVVDAKLNMIKSSYFELINSGKGLIKNLLKPSYLGGCMAFKKTVLELAFPFPAKIPIHDMWLGFVSDLFLKSYFIPEKLLLYRRHDNNSSTSGKASKYSLWEKILFRFNTVKYIPLLIKRKCNTRLKNKNA